jgi:nucleoid-associated protein YgaU
LDVVRVTPQGQATIAGRAAPDAKVSLRVDGVEIANAPSDSSGAYASLFSLPASDKARILTVAATGPDGVEVLGTDQVVLAPTVLAAPLKITEDGVQVLETAKVADNIVINSITYEAELVKVGGLGQADQSVRLYVDGAEAGSAQIAADGTWNAALSQIAPGDYTLRADQLDKDGKVTSRYETPFKRESTADLAVQALTEPATPATVTVQSGLTLWAIAEQNFGSGTMYVQVFEANKDLIRDPNLIYPGQVFNIPKSP